MPSDEKIVRVQCQDCDWERTRESIVDELKESRAYPSEPTDKMIAYKFGTRQEGHAYFHRGHKTEKIYD